MKTITNPEIYIACLASYTNGILHGKWIEVTDEESVREEIKEILNGSSFEEAEEFAIHDCQGFGSYQIGEYECISTVCEFAELIREHGDVFIELMAYHDDLDYTKSQLENCYHGEYKSEQYFANDFFDELYSHEVPKSIQYYIDYEAFCRDIFINDFYSIETDSGVHVFSRH